jgi:hypothetical protein
VDDIDFAFSRRSCDAAQLGHGPAIERRQKNLDTVECLPADPRALSADQRYFVAARL